MHEVSPFLIAKKFAHCRQEGLECIAGFIVVSDGRCSCPTTLQTTPPATMHLEGMTGWFGRLPVCISLGEHPSSGVLTKTAVQGDLDGVDEPPAREYQSSLSTV